jgi:hypothetical protein
MERSSHNRLRGSSPGIGDILVRALDPASIAFLVHNYTNRFIIVCAVVEPAPHTPRSFLPKNYELSLLCCLFVCAIIQLSISLSSCRAHSTRMLIESFTMIPHCIFFFVCQELLHFNLLHSYSVSTYGCNNCISSVGSKHIYNETGCTHTVFLRYRLYG